MAAGCASGGDPLHWLHASREDRVFLFLFLPSCGPTTSSQASDSGRAEPKCLSPATDQGLETANVLLSNAELDELGLGHSAAACDLDADGHLDLIIGGPRGPDRLGRVTLLYGPATQWPTQLDVAQAPVLLYGSEPYSYLGTSLACGDLDGDGYMDLAVGGGQTLRSNQPSPEYGAHLWYGDGTRLTSGTERSADARLSHTFEAVEGRLHYKDLYLMDLDGDEVSELLVADAQTSSEGAALHVLPGGRYADGVLNALSPRAWMQADAALTLHLLPWSGNQRLLSISGGEEVDDQALYSLPLDPGAAPTPWSTLAGGAKAWPSGAPVALDTPAGHRLLLRGTDADAGGQAVFLVPATPPETLVEITHSTAFAPTFSGYLHIQSAGDVNGDGIEDLVALMDDETVLRVLDGARLHTGRFPVEGLTLLSLSDSESPYRATEHSPLLTTDLDGDGCTDLVLRDAYAGRSLNSNLGSGEVRVFLSSLR